MTTYRVPVLEDFSWQPPVKDKDLSEQPGSGILKGDRYIVGASATGHWVGEEKNIATAKVADPSDAGDWLFDAPEEGWHVWIEDEDSLYHYTGAVWDKDDVSGLESSIDSLETVASAAIDSVDSLESEISTNKSLDAASIDSLETVVTGADNNITSINASIDSLEVVDSTNKSLADASIDSLETVASAAISSIDSLEIIDSANKSLCDASIDSLETVASAAIGSIDSLESEISTNKSLADASIDSLETAKQDIGTYVSEYGAIEFTV